MKKRLRLRPYVLPSLYLIVITLIVLATMTRFDAPTNAGPEEDLTYVSSVILSNETPVLSTEVIIIKPFTNGNVKIGKNYYDYKDNEDKQQGSIIYYENTYIQNSGIDYVAVDVFDIVSILDGTVMSVSKNDILGNTIEIKHSNNLITVYQSLSKVQVKEGDNVKQGQILGQSGTSKLNKDLGNHLHFEMFRDGEVVNPMEYYDKNIKDL